jgi:hypothetical protein
MASDRMNRRDWLSVSGLAAGAMAFHAATTPRNAVAEDSKPVGAGIGVVSGGPVAVTFQREIRVRYEVDVFVAGGGPAGAAAAVSARKQNATVFLAEGHSCFGGMGTAGRVPVFMQWTDGVHFLAGGFGHDLHERLKKASHLQSPATDIEALKRVYDDMLTESGAEFSFYTNLVAVESQNGRVSHVICSSPSGLFAVRAKTYIDATGNGDLATWAGAAFEKGDAQGNLMPGTLCSVWSDIDWKTRNAHKDRSPQPDGSMLHKAFADGVFTVRDEHLTGMVQLGETLGGGNIGHTFGVDGTDEVSITKALVQGRKSLMEFERYYREYLKGFEKTRLVATGSLLGIRETRRVLGDYVLTLADYQKRATFPDEIGRYAYPIDNHPTQPDHAAYVQHRKEFDETMQYKPGESYGIPYRILTPRSLENVLVAGRCVSADRMVHGSLRVMPGCFITGQAAGVAAAMAARDSTSVHKIDVQNLQQRLKALGSYLPNS